MFNLFRNFVLCSLFTAAFFLNVFAGEPLKQETPPPQELRIIAVETLKEQVYAEVFIEFPKQWMDPKISVEVNGKPVRTRPRSGGFSTDRNTAGIIFVPGKAGRKTVTVKAAFDGKKTEARTTLDWRPGPFLAVLSHTGNREIIFTREKLVLATANINDVRVLINSRDIHPRVSPGDVSMRSFEPVWKKGRNTLTVIAKGPDGNAVVKNYTFFYLGGGAALNVGEAAVLHYGSEGSKSGPFYKLDIEGNAVVPLKEENVYCYEIDREGWLSGQVRLTRELKGARAGASKVRIFVKHHFLENMELEREITITVKDR